MIITVNAVLLRDRSVSSYACGEVSPAVNDYILVKTEYGKEVAVCKSLPGVPEAVKKRLPTIMRKLTGEDVKRLKLLAKDEESAFQAVRNIALKYALPMKIAKVCYTFDKRRVFVYYTASSRVDFRALIKDINAALKTHVQMVQVSSTECARVIGGLGPCGRLFCCTLFQKSYSRQKQSFSSKPAGPCGKVLCCYSVQKSK